MDKKEKRDWISRHVKTNTTGVFGPSGFHCMEVNDVKWNIPSQLEGIRLRPRKKKISG